MFKSSIRNVSIEKFDKCFFINAKHSFNVSKNEVKVSSFMHQDRSFVSPPPKKARLSVSQEECKSFESACSKDSSVWSLLNTKPKNCRLRMIPVPQQMAEN